jgi:hypothetical protein
MAYFLRVKPVFGLGDAGGDSSLAYSILAAASTNANLVKAGPGTIIAIHCINVSAAVKYLKLYDSFKLPVAGQGTPVRRFGIPASTTGAGFVYTPSVAMQFVSGIGFTITGGAADSDTTALSANDVILTLEYI